MIDILNTDRSCAEMVLLTASARLLFVCLTLTSSSTVTHSAYIFHNNREQT